MTYSLPLKGKAITKFLGQKSRSKVKLRGCKENLLDFAKFSDIIKAKRKGADRWVKLKLNVSLLQKRKNK